MVNFVTCFLTIIEKKEGSIGEWGSLRTWLKVEMAADLVRAGPGRRSCGDVSPVRQGQRKTEPSPPLPWMSLCSYSVISEGEASNNTVVLGCLLCQQPILRKHYVPTRATYSCWYLHLAARGVSEPAGLHVHPK